MKQLITLLMILVSMHGFGQEQFTKIKLDATVYKDGKTRLKKTGEPLNGNYTIKINRYQTNYDPFINGLKNGEVKIFRHQKLAESG